MVLFEVPTGVVADGWGRRVSFLLGTVTLAVSTYLYYLLWQLSAPFWAWAVVSVLLGLGFTFFSGAVEAWLVDALRFSGYEGGLEPVLGRGQMVSGVAMLAGSVAGGVIAQATDLGVPFLLRVGVLLAMFVVAFWLMHDVGFTPERPTHPLRATRAVLSASIENGLKNPPVRYVMLAAPFSAGVGIYVFYALQPYLLELFGDPRAYSVAGLAAAIVAGAEVLGGWLAPRIRRLVRKRTTVLILSSVVSALILVVLGFTRVFWVALVLLALWALVAVGGHPGAAGLPERHDRLQAAGNSAQLRLAHGVQRRRGGPAAAGPGGRRLRLPGLAGDRRRDRADRGAVPAGEPAAAPPGRPGQRRDQHHKGGSRGRPRRSPPPLSPCRHGQRSDPVSVSCEATVPTAWWSPEERCRSSAGEQARGGVLAAAEAIPWSAGAAENWPAD